MKTITYPLMVIIGASCYGTLSSIIKLAIADGFTASEAVTAQYFIGLLLALILYLFTHRTRPQFGRAWSLILAGTFTAITGAVYGKAVEFMPASLAVVMLFQFTWIGLLIDCLANRRLPRRIEVISVTFLLIGTILAAGIIGLDLHNIALQGWFWGLGAALSFALYLFVNRIETPHMDVQTRLLFTSFFGSIVIALLLTPEIAWNGVLVQDGLWKYGLILGFLGIVLPISFFSVAIPKTGAATASILGAAELPVAIVASIVLVKESVTLLQIVGISIILIGMILPTLMDIRKSKKLQRKNLLHTS